MENKVEFGFWPQLVLDLHGCNQGKLNDKDYIYHLLDSLPGHIHMNKIADPHLIHYPGTEGSFDKGGVSGFVLIKESHISIHTFVEQSHAFVDIFSCKPFDVEKAEKYLVENLEAQKTDKRVFPRGREFPKEVRIVQDIIKDDREAVKYHDFDRVLKE
jgi:S-adenosylmethionine decarboxylase